MLVSVVFVLSEYSLEFSGTSTPSASAIESFFGGHPSGGCGK